MFCSPVCCEDAEYKRQSVPFQFSTNIYFWVVLPVNTVETWCHGNNNSLHHIYNNKHNRPRTHHIENDDASRCKSWNSPICQPSTVNTETQRSIWSLIDVPQGVFRGMKNSVMILVRNIVRLHLFLEIWERPFHIMPLPIYSNVLAFMRYLHG